MGPTRCHLYLLLIGALTIASGGCDQGDFGDLTPPVFPDQPEGPGDPAWGNADITCEEQSDCAPNESCEDGICVLARCKDGPYFSSAPIGASYLFFSDKEVLAADSLTYNGSYWIDGYLPTGNGLSYPEESGSWNFGTSPLVDVASGNVMGTRPDNMVVATQGSTSVSFKYNGELKSLSVGFQPIAVATGDIDQDGVDEIIALGAAGSYAVCHADEELCEKDSFEGKYVGLDVAAGDIDGDNFEEAIFLLENGDETQVLAVNFARELTSEEKIVGGTVPTAYKYIAAGRIDDSGVAKVIALNERGYLGWVDDHLDTLVFSGGAVSVAGTFAVNDASKDVAVADLDMDGREEIVLLRDERTVDVFRPVAADNYTVLYSGELTASQAPLRIDLGDFDGDSPSATQVAGPELISGPIIPTMVVHFPPYSRTHSLGLPYLFVGDSEHRNEDYSDSVNVRAGVEVGVQGGLEGVFSAGIGTRVTAEVSQRVTTSRFYTMGARFVMEPNTELHGTDYSVVMLSNSCYHAYTYQVDDPSEKLEGMDQGQFAVLVPVSGQSTVWSSRRYNAMAEAVGGLPVVTTPIKLGDPTSYPQSPKRSDGSDVPNEDKLFPMSPTFKVSDVGKAGWWLAVTERQINESSQYSEVAVNSNLSMQGFKFGAEVAGGQSSSYSIGVGSEALFGGAVPAIPDNPDTPEDEYETNAFSFSPVVHREHYTDRDGNDAAFYVLAFTVSQED